MNKGSLFFLLLFGATPAMAVDCNDLKPSPPLNTSTTFVGKIDASVDGFFAKLASVGTTAEGNYSEVSTNVLKDIPNADKLYMWERVLFLQCQMLAGANDVTNSEKLKLVGDLYSKFGSPPPSGDTMIINGNNNTQQHGNNNRSTSN